MERVYAWFRRNYPEHDTGKCIVLFSDGTCGYRLVCRYDSTLCLHASGDDGRISLILHAVCDGRSDIDRMHTFVDTNDDAELSRVFEDYLAIIGHAVLSRKIRKLLDAYPDMVGFFT